MSDWTPGEGWRVLTPMLLTQLGERPREEVRWLMPDGTWRRWVREEPAPLPTAAGTVIRPEWKRSVEPQGREDLLVLLDDGTWSHEEPDWLRSAIIRFSVVAEPLEMTVDLTAHDENVRRETADAVFDHIRNFLSLEQLPNALWRSAKNMYRGALS